MAITLGATITNAIDTTTVTLNATHTTDANTKALVVIIKGYDSVDADAVVANNGLTFGAAVLTEAEYYRNTGAGDDAFIAVYYLSNPAIEEATIALTMGGSCTDLSWDAINLVTDAGADRIILDNTDKDNLSTIWRPAIEDHEQNKVGSDKAENILISALRDALLGFADTRPRDADNYLQEMINDKYILFKRTAIHIISKYFEDLEGLAEKIINASYFKYHFQHELHHFLKECFNDFPPFMKQKALKIIELIELSDEDDLKQREIREAYRKLVWLTAIKETDCVEAVKLYKKYLAIFGKKPSHPDFSSYMESGWVV